MSRPRKESKESPSRSGRYSPTTGDKLLWQGKEITKELNEDNETFFCITIDDKKIKSQSWEKLTAHLGNQRLKKNSNPEDL